jgi:hypothetical protein
MVVQLKCDMSGGLPPVPVESADDCLFVKSERAAVDRLNLLCGLASGTVRRFCGGRFWEFSVAEMEGDCTGLRLNWFFAVRPRGSCDTALTEICDGARECDSGCE